jgi:hypothetical protein
MVSYWRNWGFQLKRGIGGEFLQLARVITIQKYNESFLQFDSCCH